MWVLARGVGILGRALALGLCVGTLVALGLGAIGLLISAACNSNKTSIAASIFLLLILFAPTQLPSGLPQGWFFDVLLRANPVASGLAYISSILVEGQLDAGPLPADHPAAHRDHRGRRTRVRGPTAGPANAGRMPDEKVALDWADGRRTDLAPGSCSRGDSAKREGGRRAGSGQDPARRPFMITTEITNTSARTSEILAHLNVASIEGSVYVDPEDWSPGRSQQLSLQPGESRKLSWEIQAVNAGHFAAYVVVVPFSKVAGNEALMISPLVNVDVASRSTLTAGGALPVVVMVPLVLGLAAAGLYSGLAVEARFDEVGCRETPAHATTGSRSIRQRGRPRSR